MSVWRAISPACGLPHLLVAESSCAPQLWDIYSQVQQIVIGLRLTQAEVIHHYGCAAGVWEEQDSIYRVGAAAFKHRRNGGRFIFIDFWNVRPST